MSARNFAPLRSLDREAVKLQGNFAGNNTSNPLSSTFVGMGWGVTRTGVGAYTLTLTEKYAALAAMSGLIASSGGAQALDIGLTAVDVSGAKTITFKTFNSTTGAAYELQSTDTLYFELTLLNSKQKPLHS